MTYEEKRQKERAEERRKINTYAPLEKLEEIARSHFPALIRRQNGLDTMDSDELDFFEASVWGLKEALIEAYLLGHKQGLRDNEFAHLDDPQAIVMPVIEAREKPEELKTTAKWLRGAGVFICSKCKGRALYRKSGTVLAWSYYATRSDYCPHCGVKLEKEVEV